MELTKYTPGNWSPFDTLEELQSDINRIFTRSLTREKPWVGMFQPDLEIREESDAYVLSVDLPGVRKEDLNISVHGNRLTLKGERKQNKENKEKGYHYSEKYYGAFTRSMEFPLEIQSDKVKASYNDGVLQIVLPKAESAKPRQVSIEVK